MLRKAIGIISITTLAGFGPAAIAQQPGTYEAVNTSNVRAGPSINDQIVTTVGKGDQVQVTGPAPGNDSWYAVQLQDGRNGYIYGRLLRQTAAASAPAAGAAVSSGSSAGQAGAKAYFITPYPGESVPGGKFWVRFGLTGMGVAPAGVEKAATGHHHLLINTDLPPLDEPIPSDDNHIHFGRGQTEIFIELPPGEHKLQLLLGDHNHVPHNPPVMSEPLTVIVP